MENLLHKPALYANVLFFLTLFAVWHISTPRKNKLMWRVILTTLLAVTAIFMFIFLSISLGLIFIAGALIIGGMLISVTNIESSR